MKELVPELRETLSSGVDLNRVGEILHNGWILKRSLTKIISNGVIDSYYEKARSAGALGGKLLGAGGGGFLLLYVEKQNRERVIKSLKELSEPFLLKRGFSLNSKPTKLLSSLRNFQNFLRDSFSCSFEIDRITSAFIVSANSAISSRIDRVLSNTDC